MFSKEESKLLRQDFWASFGKSYPHKWILYNTKIKGLTLKFHFDLKKAMVSIDVEHPNLERRMELWEKLISLKSILKEGYLPEAIFKDTYVLENGKEISSIYVALHDVSIHNKKTWQKSMIFLNNKMMLLELFFIDFKAIIES